MNMEPESRDLLGEAVRIAYVTDLRDMSLANFVDLIGPAITLKQFHIAKDRQQRPVAFFAWAYLTLEVLSELQHSGERRLLLEEWNEGHEFTLISFACLPDARFLSARLLLKMAGLTHESIHFRSSKAALGWKSRRTIRSG